MPKYPYQNDGGPMTWKNGPPPQAHAHELGGMGNYLVLPAPGAPEVLNGMGDCGCGCKGTGKCGGDGMSGITDITPVKIAEAGGAYLLYKYSKKKKKGVVKYGALGAAAYLAYLVVTG